MNFKNPKTLTLSRRRPLSCRNQSIDLGSKSRDWFLYDNGLRLERVKASRLNKCLWGSTVFIGNLKMKIRKHSLNVTSQKHQNL